MSETANPQSVPAQQDPATPTQQSPESAPTSGSEVTQPSAVDPNQPNMQIQPPAFPVVTEGYDPSTAQNNIETGG